MQFIVFFDTASSYACLDFFETPSRSTEMAPYDWVPFSDFRKAHAFLWRLGCERSVVTPEAQEAAGRQAAGLDPSPADMK